LAILRKSNPKFQILAKTKFFVVFFPCKIWIATAPIKISISMPTHLWLQFCIKKICPDFTTPRLHGDLAKIYNFPHFSQLSKAAKLARKQQNDYEAKMFYLLFTICFCKYYNIVNLWYCWSISKKFPKTKFSTCNMKKLCKI